MLGAEDCLKIVAIYILSRIFHQGCFHTYSCFALVRELVATPVVTDHVAFCRRRKTRFLICHVIQNRPAGNWHLLITAAVIWATHQAEIIQRKKQKNPLKALSHLRRRREHIRSTCQDNNNAVMMIMHSAAGCGGWFTPTSSQHSAWIKVRTRSNR